MAVYDLAAIVTRPPSQFRRELVTNSAILQSSLSMATQTISRMGEHWRLELVWENINGEQRNKLTGLLMRLRGAKHRVIIPEYGYTKSGAGVGVTPVVDGAGQTGETLQIRGATPSITNWIRAGDMVGFLVGGSIQTVMCTDDADSDAGGIVSIPIVPSIRTSPDDGATVDYLDSSIRGVFILASDVNYDVSTAALRGPADRISTISASFVEDVV